MLVDANGYLNHMLKDTAFESLLDGTKISLDSLQGPMLGVLIMTAAVGVLWCFFGLKLVRVWSAILGFALGLSIGSGIAFSFHLETAVVWGIGIAAGIVLACLGIFLYRVGIFLVALAVGFSLAAMVIRPAELVTLLVCFGIGAAVALLTIAYAEPVTMVVTALYGASGLGTLASRFLSFDFLENEIIQYVFTFVIFILGVWVQFLLESGKRKKQSLRKAKEIREQHSTENEVEKARALMENLDELPEVEKKGDDDV